jgi:hypothetical protein
VSQDHQILKDGLLNNVLVCQALKALIAEMHSLMALGAQEGYGALRQAHVGKEPHAGIASGT